MVFNDVVCPARKPFERSFIMDKICIELEQLSKELEAIKTMLEALKNER